MNWRTSLALAVVFGGLAVAIVAVDVVYSIEARIDRQEEGRWVTQQVVAGRGYWIAPEHVRAPYAVPYGDCSPDPVRLTVDNHRPIPARVPVLVQYQNGTSGRTVTLLDETWSLGAFEARDYAVPPIPAGAFPPPITDPPGTKARPGQLSLGVSVASTSTSVCIGPEVT